MQVYKPWVKNFYSSYDRKWYTSEGQVADVLSDFRANLNKTAPGAWRPPTSYDRSVESNANTIHVVGHAKDPDYGDIVDFSGATNCSGYWYSYLPEFPQRLQDRCEIGARLQLKSEDFNVATNLAERGQTASLIEQNCKRLYNGIRAAKRLDGKGLLKALGLSRRQLRKGSAFDMWLEVQYGWKPLLSDVHAAVTKLSDDEHGARPPIVTVKKSGKDRDSFLTYPNSDCLQSVVGNVRFQKLHKVEHKCMVRLDFTPGTSAFRTAKELGLTNPLELAWEELPFSFVVDWFYPVGDYFSQLDATLGYDFKGGSISKKTTMKTQMLGYDFLRTDGNPSTASGYCYSSSTGYQMSFTRRPYGSAPLPLPHLSFKDYTSSDHVSNGIALLASAFSKKKVDFDINL